VDRRIRRYIRAKRKLIALLTEQKQAIIHRAVTRGLDPDVRLKPSGVEWLGEVPEHWEVMPLRRVTISRCDGPFGSGLKSSHYSEHGVRVVRLQNIGHAEFKDSDAAFISPEYNAELGDHSVEPGDLLIAGLGDERHPAGRACVAPSCIGRAMVKADCFRFRIDKHRLDAEFAALHLTATAAGASAVLSSGATRQRTNLQVTASRRICFPSLKQQVAINRYLSSTIEPIRAATNRAQREIDLLREYRTRLIADVVTGKLDVREAASRLPADAAEAEA
jgi:type I restriction enzyme, S subunit